MCKPWQRYFTKEQIMETTVLRPSGPRRILLAGALALAALLGAPCVPVNPGSGAALAQDEASIDIDTFHEALGPYGQWVDTPQYGEVWYPTTMRPGWRPYYDDGHWVYSDDDGWTWVSDLPWGWAPFHYGRWAEDPQYGWIWVPGRVWGPAWVTFRQSDEAIGWAPLPPDTGWDPAYGYQGDSNIGVSIGADLWNFVRPEGFLEPGFGQYAYDRRDYPRFINQTRNITNITVVNNRIVNRSIDVRDVERMTHRQVEHVTISASDRPDRAKVSGKSVVIYKPAVVERGESQTQATTSMIKEDPGQDNKKRPVTGAAVQQKVQPNKQEPAATKNSEVKPVQGNPGETLQTRQTKKQKQMMQPGSQSGNEQELLQTQNKKKNNGAAPAPNFVSPEQETSPSAGKQNKQQLRQELKHKPEAQPEQGQPAVTKKQKCKTGADCANNND
jgi:hypothetical protein